MLERIVAKFSIAGIIGALLFAALLVQTFRIEGFKLWPLKVAGLKAELADARAELAKLSTTVNTQRAETGRNIERAKESRKQAEPIARRIENAPLPGNCTTPREIMEAPL